MFNLSRNGVLPGVVPTTGLGVSPPRGVKPSCPWEGVLEEVQIQHLFVFFPPKYFYFQTSKCCRKLHNTINTFNPVVCVRLWKHNMQLKESNKLFKPIKVYTRIFQAHQHIKRSFRNYINSQHCFWGEITQSPVPILGYSNQDLIATSDLPTTWGKTFTLNSDGLTAVPSYNLMNCPENRSLL